MNSYAVLYFEHGGAYRVTGKTNGNKGKKTRLPTPKGGIKSINLPLLPLIY